MPLGDLFRNVMADALGLGEGFLRGLFDLQTGEELLFASQGRWPAGDGTLCLVGLSATGQLLLARPGEDDARRVRLGEGPPTLDGARQEVPGSLPGPSGDEELALRGSLRWSSGETAELELPVSSWALLETKIAALSGGS